MKRASTARGHLRDEICELVVAFYKLKLETGKKKARQDNEQRYCYFMEGSLKRFCYKDFDRADPCGYAELRLLLHGLQQHLFKDRHSLGAENIQAFNPLPLATLALLLTTNEFCLDAWSTGEFNSQLMFKESVYCPKFEAHLQQLKEWEEINPTVIRKICGKMFHRVVSMGNVPVQTSTVQLGGLSDMAAKFAQEELAGRTGKTDSEADE
ncbi:hypothetical protein EW026_g8025 [Hermanssonia centrifuga]|uniref:DUF6532 domain-containing protein n=1 Tax=Hermanssonia centrifuga TaxID=98765 RepID=A0A4S4K5W3_9APHY|nr:hypothetical protein EW026_g8025 [Hermanssonia centrifuga]